jgi:hypothetical protein
MHERVREIVVSDKGLNTEKNAYYLTNARAIVQNPQNFNKKNTYGAAKYVHQILYTKNGIQFCFPPLSARCMAELPQML